MTRHAEADTRPVTIERSDAIDAAGALLVLAIRSRKDAKRRRYAGPELSSYRAQLRASAHVYEAAAARIQRQADEAF